MVYQNINHPTLVSKHQHAALRWGKPRALPPCCFLRNNIIDLYANKQCISDPPQRKSLLLSTYTINYFSIRHKGHVPTIHTYFGTIKLHEGECNYWNGPAAGTPVGRYSSVSCGLPGGEHIGLHEGLDDAWPGVGPCEGSSATLSCVTSTHVEALRWGGWGQIPCAPALFISKRQLSFPCIAVHTLKKQRNNKGEIFLKKVLKYPQFT